mgnify:CR=1 FL=1
MYAIVETGGKQYRVQEGDVIRVERLAVEDGEAVVLDKVLLVGQDDGVLVGTPYLQGASVSASVVTSGKGDKVIVFKYKSKKNYRRLRGHRQLFTDIRIDGIRPSRRAGCLPDRRGAHGVLREGTGRRLRGRIRPCSSAAVRLRVRPEG